MHPTHGTFVPVDFNERSSQQQAALDEMVPSEEEIVKRWGGAREGAGRPHEHQEYILVEVVDFYGDKDALIVGLVGSKGVDGRAQSIAAHHVNEQAQSVKIVKRSCCSNGESTVVETVK